MLQWCCYYLRSISVSSIGEWNSRLVRCASLMLQMERKLLPLSETWEKALAGASWAGVNICLWGTGSVWLLTRQSSSQEPCLFAAEMILRCLTSGTAFYSPCEYMSYEPSSMGWQERQIRHQRMRNAEILAWFYGCTPAVELHFYSHYRVRITQECSQVCSSWKQGAKPFQNPEAIDFSQRISS